MEVSDVREFNRPNSLLYCIAYHLKPNNPDYSKQLIKWCRKKHIALDNLQAISNERSWEFHIIDDQKQVIIAPSSKKVKTVINLIKKTDHYCLIVSLNSDVQSNPVSTRDICLTQEGENILLGNSLSVEQCDYVFSDKDTSTILYACPGSGKTQCAILRIIHLLQTVPGENIMYLTFSRESQKAAQERFRKFCTSPFALKHIRTFHSFAGSILNGVRHHNIDPQGLKSISTCIIHLRNLLRFQTVDSLKDYPYLKTLTDVFIDEAQDIDAVQNEVLQLLSDRLNVKLHWIGDPNQNIYQFRGSSSSYFLQASGVKFHLSHNYRSSDEIVQLTNDLLVHIPDVLPLSVRGTLGKPVTFHKLAKQDLIKNVIKIIQSKYWSEPKSLHDIAILVPTKKGKEGLSVGGSGIFNALVANNLPVNICYSIDNDVGCMGNKTHIVPGKVNILTIHASKGLEFPHVILLDYHHLLHHTRPIEGQHDYLIYVALTRAIDRLDIFMLDKSVEHSSFMKINPSKYVKANDFTGNQVYDFAQKLRDSPTHTVTKMIENLTQEDKLQIEGLLRCEVIETTSIPQIIFPVKAYHNFKGIFVETLVRYLYERASGVDYIDISIDELLNSGAVIVNEFEYSKIIDAQKRLGTWQIVAKRLSESNDKDERKILSRLLTLRKDGVELRDMTFAQKDDENDIIQSNIPTLREHYLNCTTENFETANVVNIGFVTAMKWLIAERHIGCLNDVLETVVHPMNEHLSSIKDFVLELVRGRQCTFDVSTREPLSNYNGIADLIVDGLVCEIKCTQETYTLEHLIQLYLYRYALHQDTDDVELWNFQHGLRFKLRLTCSDTWSLLNIIWSTNKLRIQRAHFVFDLETNGLIDSDFIPQPIQISIKEFSRSIPVMTSFIKLKQRFDQKAAEIHGISKSTLATAPTIESVRSQFKNVLKNCDQIVLWAHNGSKFDHKVMKHFDFYKSLNVDLMDTLALIQEHTIRKLDNYRLSTCLQQLTDKAPEDFKLHDAEGDVDALCYILKFMNIEL